jgi:hypothetical protein
METELADSLAEEKIIMNYFPSVSTFKIQLTIGSHTVGILLHLFCGNPASNKKKMYSYNIVGKIGGLKNTEATADIISDYGSGNQLKDHFIVEHSQFIFSNQSLVPAGLNIRMRLKGILPVDCSLTADINIEMKFTLKQILVNGITSG